MAVCGKLMAIQLDEETGTANAIVSFNVDRGENVTATVTTKVDAESLFELKREEPQTRVYKKGDHVIGTRFADREFEHDGCSGVVAADENYGGSVGNVVYVQFANKKSPVYVSICNLKLVTPVEKLNPYIAVDNTESQAYTVRNASTNRVVAQYYYGGESPAYSKQEACERAKKEVTNLYAKNNQN